MSTPTTTNIPTITIPIIHQMVILAFGRCLCKRSLRCWVLGPGFIHLEIIWITFPHSSRTISNLLLLCSGAISELGCSATGWCAASGDFTLMRFSRWSLRGWLLRPDFINLKSVWIAFPHSSRTMANLLLLCNRAISELGCAAIGWYTVCADSLLIGGGDAISVFVASSTAMAGSFVRLASGPADSNSLVGSVEMVTPACASEESSLSTISCGRAFSSARTSSPPLW